jgi:transposase
MEKMLMSRKERLRLEVLSRVRCRQISQGKAAELLGLSRRQVVRMYARFLQRGAKGLLHALRGRASNRGHGQEHRDQVVLAYQRRYCDFGPTLAAEQMLKGEKLEVDHETLRRWLKDEGLWRGRRARGKHRSRRERKEHRGELVQLDGSPHDWLEGRGARMTLIEFVDDATSMTYGRFYHEETTEAVMDCLKRYMERYGVPRALYVDKDSIYTVNNREATGAEILAGKEPQTQFARAAEELSIRIILANSPQAKGRVERVHGTQQDRLVKLMRLEGITTMAQSNDYLESQYWKQYNDRFARAAAQQADLHRKSPGNLDSILCLKEKRTVSRDWCVSYERRVLQIEAKHQSLGLAGQRVEVRQHLDGSLRLQFRGRALSYHELEKRPEASKERPQFRARKQYQPAADHPFRQPFGRRAGVGDSSAAPQSSPPLPKNEPRVTVLTS